MRDALALMEIASPWAAESFREHGEIHPMYHALCTDGRHAVMPVRGDDRDEWVAAARKAFERIDAVAYVFICEGWAREMMPADEAEAMRLRAEWLKSGIANDPKRIEVVMLIAEDAEGIVMASRRIIRHKGRPHLGKLKVDDTIKSMEGRMVGLLSIRETRQ
jgi:hypothetical protein